MSIATIGRAIHQIIEGRIARGENTGIELANLSDLRGNVIIFDGLPDRPAESLERNKVVTAEFYRRELARLHPMLYEVSSGHAAWWSPVQSTNFGAHEELILDDNLEDKDGDIDGVYVAVVRDIALTALDVRRPNAVKSTSDEVGQTSQASQASQAEQTKQALPWPF